MSGSEQNIFVEKLQKAYFGFDLGVGPVVARLKDSASHTHVGEVVCLSLPVELVVSVEKISLTHCIFSRSLQYKVILWLKFSTLLISMRKPLFPHLPHSLHSPNPGAH